MATNYMSGSEYSASLSAALNSYWQTLERRWIRDAGTTLRGGTSQISGAPKPARWQVPVTSRGHLTTCPHVDWAINDGMRPNRPPKEACDGWSVPDAQYVECNALDVLCQVEDWAWEKREQLASGVPDLAGGPELSFLEEAHTSLVEIDQQMRSEGSIDDHALAGLVDWLSGGHSNNNKTRAWMTGWTGLAASSLKGGLLSTVKPTLVNQAILVDWLANCYSVRSTTIHTTRNNILNLIGQATRDLDAVVVTQTNLATEKFAVSAASQAWNVAQQSIDALSKLPVVGTVIGLVDFALSTAEKGSVTQFKFPQLGDFFTHLDSAVRALHSELDSAEDEYEKAVKYIEQEVDSVDRSMLELYDPTQHSPDGDGSDPSASGNFSVDVAVVLEIAQHCYDVAEIYSGLLSKVATTSYADGQLVGRGMAAIPADRTVAALRNDLESFIAKATQRYLTAGDRIKAAAELYARTDEEQEETFETTIRDWRSGGHGEYGQRNKIDLDPDKEGVQN
jgi:hypothetical protein